MPDIADQLRRYADAVVDHHGPSPRSLDAGPAIVEHEQPVTVLHRQTPPRRSPRLVLAAAAVVLAAGIGAVALRAATETVTTDLPPSTTASTDPARPPSVAPLLLPDAGEWQMIAFDHGVNTPEPSLRSDDVMVFDLDGTTLLLLARPSDSAPAPLDHAETTTQHNRSHLTWTVDGTNLSLMGFDTDPGTLVDAATSLRFDNGAWRIDGAQVVVDEPGRTQEAAGSTQIRFARIDADGNLDPGVVIEQHSGAASNGDLFRALHEASGLGTTSRIDTGIGAGWIVTGGVMSYAIVYRNGIVTSWQTTRADVDLEAFIASLTPVDNATWNAAVTDAPSALSEAISRQADALAPIEVAELPRFLLDEPYELVTVNDPSQWTDEQRRQAHAFQEAISGQASYRILLNQTFRLADNSDALVPDIVVQTQQSIGQRNPIDGTDDAQTVSMPAGDDPSQRYEGVVYGPDPTRPNMAVAVLTRDDITFEIISPTLAPDALATLLESMSARADDTGVKVNLEQAGLVPGVEVAEQAAGAASGWSTVWSAGPNPNDRIEIRVDPEPRGHTDIELAYAVIYGGNVEQVDPDELYLMVRYAGGGGYLLWPGHPTLDTETEAAVRIFGGADGPADTARALRQVDEAEWTDTVAPFIEPPALSSGN